MSIPRKNFQFVNMYFFFLDKTEEDVKKPINFFLWFNMVQNVEKWPKKSIFAEKKEKKVYLKFLFYYFRSDYAFLERPKFLEFLSHFFVNRPFTESPEFLRIQNPM